MAKVLQRAISINLFNFINSFLRYSTQRVENHKYYLGHDVGQMDMYVRMYDELKRTDGDNPTIGLILCSQTSDDMARYSMLKESSRLFQAKYLTFLPTKEELTNEIERQKMIFRLEQQTIK